MAETKALKKPISPIQMLFILFIPVSMRGIASSFKVKNPADGGCKLLITNTPLAHTKIISVPATEIFLNVGSEFMKESLVRSDEILIRN